MTEKFKILTKYISELKDDGFGEWISERENDGSLECPFQMSFVNYSASPVPGNTSEVAEVVYTRS